MNRVTVIPKGNTLKRFSTQQKTCPSAAPCRSDSVWQGFVEPWAEPERSLQTAAGEGLPVHWQGRICSLLRPHGDSVQRGAAVRLHSTQQTPQTSLPAAGTDLFKFSDLKKETTVFLDMCYHFFSSCFLCRIVNSPMSVTDFSTTFLSRLTLPQTSQSCSPWRPCQVLTASRWRLMRSTRCVESEAAHVVQRCLAQQ